MTPATDQLAMPFAPATQARARHHDPDTSKLAAREHEASGVAHARRIRIRQALQALGRPATPGELAELTGIEYVETQRRMSEVRALGWAEVCGRATCPIRGTATRLWRAC